MAGGDTALIKAIENFEDFPDHAVRQLEGLGFTVPACTQSNYAMTILSLSSSLNMNYVNALGGGEQANLEEKILNSQTRELLESRGYRTVALESSIWFTVTFFS